MCIKFNPRYKYREIAGAHYLISIGGEGSGTPIQLTDTAFWIWQQLKKGMEYGDIVDAMTNEYEVDLHTARRGVKGFIDMLINRGIVRE